MKEEILNRAVRQMNTPCYVFDTDIFMHRVELVRRAFGNRTKLCYSIKANPFLLKGLPDGFSLIEVCSPGELSICEKISAPLDKIVFSGVSKTRTDIERAFADGVAMFTAESKLHVQLVNECAVAHNARIKMLLRIAHGSQFGMDTQDVKEIVSHRKDYEGLDIVGFHYFTGTQKSNAMTIDRELEFLDHFCEEMEKEYGFSARHIEYGTGLAVEYYKDFTERTDLELLDKVGAAVRRFSEKYPLTVEMGRFFTAECGLYLTKVMDIKTNGDTNYVICDGGINQLNYYGQNMAMKVPPICVLNKYGQESMVDYCLCGSLCTTADILVRKVTLPGLELGDVICFSRCGAYSISEGIANFLSRELPGVALYNRVDGLVLSRRQTETYPFHMP